MASVNSGETETSRDVYRSYPLDVAVVVNDDAPPDDRYQFVAPEHVAISWPSPEPALLYADIYFDVNGFVEADTGKRGVPPEIIQAGRDTLAAYFLTYDELDKNWVASYFGKPPEVIDRYVAAVEHRAKEIRAQIDQ